MVSTASLLRWLFDGSSFLTRDHCGDWPSGLKTIYLVSAILVSGSYFFLAFLTFSLSRQNDRSSPLARTLLFFSLFFFLCGAEHSLDVVVFRWAPYRLFTLILFLTGLSAVFLSFHFPSAISYVQRVFRSEKVEKELTDKTIESIGLEKEKKELEQRVAFLSTQITDLENRLESMAWAKMSTDDISAMTRILRSMRRTAGDDLFPDEEDGEPCSS